LSSDPDSGAAFLLSFEQREALTRYQGSVTRFFCPFCSSQHVISFFDFVSFLRSYKLAQVIIEFHVVLQYATPAFVTSTRKHTESKEWKGPQQ